MVVWGRRRGREVATCMRVVVVIVVGEANIVGVRLGWLFEERLLWRWRGWVLSATLVWVLEEEKGGIK